MPLPEHLLCCFLLPGCCCDLRPMLAFFPLTLVAGMVSSILCSLCRSPSVVLSPRSALPRSSPPRAQITKKPQERSKITTQKQCTVPGHTGGRREGCLPWYRSSRACEASLGGDCMRVAAVPSARRRSLTPQTHCMYTLVVRNFARVCDEFRNSFKPAFCYRTDVRAQRPCANSANPVREPNMTLSFFVFLPC